MIPKTYCWTLVAGLALLASINAIPMPAFNPAGPPTMCRGLDIAFESKLNHIAQSPPVDIMLFGNSRIIAIGSEELGLSGVTVFNTGSGGTSFRQSVETLEQVVAAGKLPKVAVLSFDHVSLLYAQLAAEWPPVPARWPMVAGDILALPGASHRVGADLRFFAKQVFVDEVNYVARLVNIRLLWPRILTIAGVNMPCQPYRADGSRPLPHRVTSDLDGKPLPVYTPADARYTLLEHDLDRLVAIQRKGVKVIIYESPLLPAWGAMVEPRLPDEQRGQRQRLLEGGRTRGLEVHPAPVINGSDTDGYWSDTNHAPPAALGRFIAGLIRPVLQQARAEQ